MQQLGLAFAIFLAVGIIVIGGLYVSQPRRIARGFGLPLPESGPLVDSWLRLKGVRDIASGLIVLVALRWLGLGPTGTVLLAASIIPIGDMLVVLAGRGSRRSAFGIHGVTAAVMIVAGLCLATGGQ